MGLLIRNARILTLAGDTRPRRGAAMRELGVVPAGDLQLVRAGHLHHLRREGETVGELLEEGVILLIHLVVTDARRQLTEPQGVRVADECD